MAKGLRATTRKRNNVNLRAKVFGPAYDARTERLSAKLQALAAKPRPDQERVMDVDVREEESKDEIAAMVASTGTEDIEIDGRKKKKAKKNATDKKPRLSRVQKMHPKKRSKASIVFAPSTAQRKRMEAQKRRS